MQQIIDNKLQIIMVEPLGDGGIAHYTYNLLNALTTKDAKATLFTNKNYEFENKQVTFIVKNKMFKIANWLIRNYPVLDSESGPLSIIRRLVKLIEYPFNTIEILLFSISNNINIIHLQSVNLVELIMIIIFRIFNKKIFFTIHNVLPRHRKLRFYHIFIYKIMYSLCNKIIIHSSQGKNDVIDLFGVDSNKIEVIPHGDYKFFIPENKIEKPEAKKKIGLPENCRTILFFGAIRKNKGLNKILLAMPDIIKKLPDARLLIVGEPWESYDKYNNIITEYNMLGNIFEKLDYISNDEVSLYFVASDVVVLPYKSITQSGVLQIAYAFGKPVVASDLAGFREAVVDGKNGYLVPYNNVQLLSEKICMILSDNKKIDEMGNFSLNLSDTKYSWNSIAKKTLSLYKQVSSNICL